MDRKSKLAQNSVGKEGEDRKVSEKENTIVVITGPKGQGMSYLSHVSARSQVQPRQTEYEKYKEAKDPVFDGKGKRLISKAGTINDGPCPLSTEGYCNVARAQ